jgi:uncharacterized repeat protein (TIGR01451 family)
MTMNTVEHSPLFGTWRHRSTVLIAVAALTGATAFAQVRPTHRADIPDFDSRAVNATAALAPSRGEAKARLASMLPRVSVDIDPLLQTPSFIRSQDGFLSGPGGQGRAITSSSLAGLDANDPLLPIKAFLNEHAALYGHGAESLAQATVKKEFTDAHNGLHTVVWQQQFDGLPIFQSTLMGHVTKAGELVSISSRFMNNLQAAADSGTPNWASVKAALPVSAVQAISAAIQNIGGTVPASGILATGNTVSEGYSVFSTPFKGYARLVWLPLDAGKLRLAWETIMKSPSSKEDFSIIVDAQTSQILMRQSLAFYLTDATYNIYPSDSPSPFSPGLQTPGTTQPALVPRTLVTTPALDTNASPAGWIPDTGNTTTGNNIDAFLDRNFDQQPDQARPVGNPNRVFNFTLDLTQDPTNYIDATTTQLFYKANYYHDRLYQLGFTEAAGNYQDDNFGRGGLGGDHIIAFAQAGADIGFNNNSFFIPAPDGINGQCDMFIFTGPNPMRDGSLDSDVVYHELTHGTSWRLVGGGYALGSLQGNGMGEGWSDFYALCLSGQPTDDPNLAYPMGGYVTYRFFGMTQNYYYGIRHYPYCTDMTKNPFTYKDIDPTRISPHTGVPLSPLYPFDPNEGPEVHHQGEVWCSTLWEVHANLVTKYGFVIGNQLTLQLVTDGLKLTPALPTFLQARDAILLADRIDNGGANQFELWSAFAKRGMGYSAVGPAASTTTGVLEAFDLPGVNVDHEVISGGNGNGIIDFNECNDLYVALVNNAGFLVTGVSGRLSTTTPGVIVVQPRSAYADLTAGATNLNQTAYKISTSPNFVCGTPINFSLVIKTDQTTTTNNFVMTTGTSGTVLNFSSGPSVAIPDNDPAGAYSPIVVSNVTSAISKLTVSLFITHTFDQDLTLYLISPGGVTNILSSHNGGSGDNYGGNCSPDTQRTTFDDAATTSINSAVPPFIGTFSPQQSLAIFNGATGTNINGTWLLHVVDDAQIDLGSIQCWSLNLAAAQCTDGGGECPGSDLALGMVSTPEPLLLGGNLTYTISVTNNGPSSAKNVSVTHLLPANVVFQSVTLSQGSYSLSGGVLNCNLGTLNARSRATITVVVLPTVAGTLTSSATTSSDQTDFDTSNNSATVISHVNPPTSDMAVGLVASPEPVVLGGTVTYTMSVTNNGPSPASGIVVTNLLPASMAILSAKASQGSLTVSSNVVICSLGSLAAGAHASAVITATATTEGSFVAVANVTANQLDPISNNNTASATSTVGPAADLGITIIDNPDPVVLRSNLNYQIIVTNRGPSTATGVTVSGNLPSGLTVVSSNTSQGVITIAGNSVTVDIGTLNNNSGVVINLRVFATNNGSITFSAAVTGAQTDQNPANNSASATTLVAAPFVALVPSGATLTAESVSPTNGAVDIGETVTVNLRLRNTGNVNTTNLVATLLAGNGVTPVGPNSPQSYGVVQASGLPVGKSFTFTANGPNNGSVVAVLQLQDGASNLGTASFTFGLPNVITFANTNAITIRDNNSALPYPSSLNVAGVTGVLGKVTVTLSNLTHTFPQDVDVLVVSPSGQKNMLMSGAGAPPVDHANVSFDDGALLAIPDGSAQIASGSYRPAAYISGFNLPSPAPAGPYPSAMSSFNAAPPNGTWSLYANDHTAGDLGNIAGGWSLALTMISPVNQLADVSISGVASPATGTAGSTISYTFTVTNAGPNDANFVTLSDVLPANVTLLSAAAGQGALITNASSVTANLGPLAAGASTTVSVVLVPSPSAAGLLTNVASVSASEIDLNQANNTSAVVTPINLPLADLSLLQVAPTNPIVIGSAFNCILAVTNNGPGNALNVMVSNSVPGALGYLSSTSSVGSCSLAGGVVIANLGTLAPGAGATITLGFNALALGLVTNNPVLFSNSSDTNAANNGSSAVMSIVNPSSSIAAAGSALLTESGPANGTIDNGETVTVSLILTNRGSANTTNLIATLLNGGGVTVSGGSSQSYGLMVHGGAAVARSFTFTANGVSGGIVTATLQLTDGGSSLGSVPFVFNLPVVTSYSNTAAITIPDHGSGIPYPSSITVSGLTGAVSHVRATLQNVTHSFPRDINALLVNPAGVGTVLLSHVGAGHAVTNVSLTFDDGAAASLPSSDALTAGMYKPTALGVTPHFPSPAPGAAPSATLGALIGNSPNGTWSLYVFDDSVGDAGSIVSGWKLDITSVVTVSPVADIAAGLASSPGTLFVGGVITNTITVTNLGPAAATGVSVTNFLAPGETFVSLTSSQGSYSANGGVVTWTVGNLAAGGVSQASVITAPGFSGVITNLVIARGDQTDLDTVNNSQISSIVVSAPVAARVGASMVAGKPQITITAQAGLAYIVQASTNLTVWTAISTNVASAGGIIKITDQTTPSLKARYYRAVRVLP